MIASERERSAVQGAPSALAGGGHVNDSGLEVVVGVLTYKRPTDLLAALPLLVAQVRTLVPAGTVLVVDNDPAASARDVVQDLARTEPVRYVHEPEPGIAAARNRALDEAGSADLLVFIDDDERPVDGWLVRLVDTYRVDRPAAVVGPVVSEYEQQPDAWVSAGRFFDRRRLVTGTETSVAATNNLLLDLAQVRALGLRFDQRFGLSGGSDMLLTRQLTAAGGRMVWCDEAVVVDVVPPDRVTRRWVLARAFRSGNTWSRTSLVLADGALGRGLVRVRLTAQGAVRALGGIARMGLGLLTRSLSHQAHGRRTLARGAGMLAGAYGTVYVEYSRDGSRTVRATKVPTSS